MAEQEPTPERRTKPLPPLNFEDSLTRAALRGRRVEDFPVGPLGGRFAAFAKTIQVSDADYFEDESLRED